jgi:hypothetical protein
MGPVVTPDDAAQLEADRARLEAEVSDLRAQLADAEKPSLGHRARGPFTVLLVILTAVVVTVAVAGVWARRNALNTDRWVRTVGPIAEDAAVQDALGRYLTDQLMTALDPQDFFQDVLPERGQILAVPLTNALRGFVNDQVDNFLGSETFATLWVDANERVHARVVDLLEGREGPLQESGAVQIEDGEVVMNLVPVLNALLARIGDLSPEILGRSVDIPTVSVDEIPQEAITRIEEALGRDLPDDFGQFTVFDASALTEVQDAVQLFDRLVVLAVVLGVLLIAVTLWVSPHRRRTLLQLLLGIALGIVLVRRAGIRAETEVVDMVRVPENREAAGVIVGAFVSSLLDATEVILWIVAGVAVIAVLTGSYPWVVAGRRRAVSLARAGGGAVMGAASHRGDPAVAEWVARNREALQVGGVVVAVLVLLLLDLSWWGILVLALLLVGYELVVQRLAETPEGPGEGAGPEGGGAEGGVGAGAGAGTT